MPRRPESSLRTSRMPRRGGFTGSQSGDVCGAAIARQHRPHHAAGRSRFLGAFGPVSDCGQSATQASNRAACFR
jgi:hypothetical protein